MKIVIESAVVFNKSHEERLSKLGEFEYYKSKGTKQEFLDQVKDSDAIILTKTFFNECIPDIKAKLISTWATGYDPIDTKKCREHGITVSNVPGYSTDSVAEHVFAFIMEFTKNIKNQTKEMKQGKWNYAIKPVTEINGKTLGVIGYGNIGKAVAKLALAFGMNVLIYNRSKINDYKQVELNELLNISDFVTIHVALTQETKHMISKTQLELMKPSAYLINCARGAIVNENDLVEALKNKTIAAAGLDVFSKEPLSLDHVFHKLNNIILTPHMAFVTNEALEKLGYLCIENVEHFLNGSPINVVNR